MGGVEVLSEIIEMTSEVIWAFLRSLIGERGSIKKYQALEVFSKVRRCAFDPFDSRTSKCLRVHLFAGP